MNKVLLTGSNGFIGRAFQEAWKGPLVCVSRQAKEHILTDQSTFLIQNLDKFTCWDGAFKDVDCVVHLASLAHKKQFKKAELDSVNIQGTLRLALQAANSGVARFIYISTIGVLGNRTINEPFNERTEPAPHNPYTKSKYIAEERLKELCKTTKMELVIIRPPLVYGRNAPGNFSLLTKAVKVLPVLPFGLTNNRRSFISVSNLVDLIATCIKCQNAANKTFNATELLPISTKQLTNSIASAWGKHCLQLPIPTIIIRAFAKLVGKGKMYEQLFESLEIDPSYLLQELKWTPPQSTDSEIRAIFSRDQNNTHFID